MGVVQINTNTVLLAIKTLDSALNANQNTILAVEMALAVTKASKTANNALLILIYVIKTLANLNIR